MAHFPRLRSGASRAGNRTCGICDADGAVRPSADAFPRHVYRVILSVVQVFRVRKTGDPLLQSLRNINLSNALVSLFALQITLVAVNGSVDEDMRVMNIITGFLVCALTIALGSYMIIRACRKLGQIRREREVVPDER